MTVNDLINALKARRSPGSEERLKATERMHELQAFSLGTPIVGWDDQESLVAVLVADDPVTMTMTAEGLEIATEGA